MINIIRKDFVLVLKSCLKKIKLKFISRNMGIDDITQKIIKAAFNVHNNLGCGFLEKVYRNAMLVELDEMFLEFEYEKPIKVCYKKQLVGEYFADILVEDCVIVELKAVEKINPIHEVQLVNYLTATGIDDGLLINFGSSVTVKRKYRTRI